ncbi:MAG: hypothetical protein DHS20C11_06260 [Lysobacteraceae bacterium]|nr:MAG: hypothetical protein DHS20C11_06260 [Xanthomonadaceae bacterium]
MSVSKADLIKELAKLKQFPDLQKLIEDGKVRKSGAWVEILDISVLEELSPWVVSVKTATSKNAKVKLSKPSKSLQKLLRQEVET